MNKYASMMMENKHRIRSYLVDSAVLLAAFPDGEWVTAKWLSEKLNVFTVTPQRLGKQLKDMLETGKVKLKCVGGINHWKKV